MDSCRVIVLSCKDHEYVHQSSDKGSNIDTDVRSSARAALLFSGGVDSTLLAYMLHKCVFLTLSIHYNTLVVIA